MTMMCANQKRRRQTYQSQPQQQQQQPHQLCQLPRLHRWLPWAMLLASGTHVESFTFLRPSTSRRSPPAPFSSSTVTSTTTTNYFGQPQQHPRSPAQQQQQRWHCIPSLSTSSLSSSLTIEDTEVVTSVRPPNHLKSQQQYSSSTSRHRGSKQRATRNSVTSSSSTTTTAMQKTKKKKTASDMFTGWAMWQHELLTKQEELELGRQVQQGMYYQTKLVEYYRLYLVQQPSPLPSSSLKQQQHRRKSPEMTDATPAAAGTTMKSTATTNSITSSRKTKPTKKKTVKHTSKDYRSDDEDSDHELRARGIWAVQKMKKDDANGEFLEWGVKDDEEDEGYSWHRSGSSRLRNAYDSEQEQDEDWLNLSIYGGGGGRLQYLEEEHTSWSRIDRSGSGTLEDERDGAWGLSAPRRTRRTMDASSPSRTQTTASSKKKNKGSSNDKDWNRKASLSILKQIPDYWLREEWDTTRSDIQECLKRGAMARETLIRSNVRLVVNLAQQWCKQQHHRATNNGGSSSNSHESMYQGSWDRPSLDEAVQEGILGLAKAADRYEPQRDLRFSTYATLWVTSQIRKCFQKASTPGWTIPSALLDQKSRYQKILKSHYDHGGGSTLSPLSFSDIAREMGLSSTKKLEWILWKTRPAVSTDQPVSGGGGGRGQQQSTMTWAGKAGNTEPDDPSHVLGSNLVDPADAAAGTSGPYHAIEWSGLRQSLENAMASELVPYERDILRLRLGLDDGVSRTVPQVVQAMSASSSSSSSRTNNNEDYPLLLTASQVRTAESRAYRKLRSPRSVQTYQLLSYLDICGIDKADCTKGLRL